MNTCTTCAEEDWQFTVSSRVRLQKELQGQVADAVRGSDLVLLMADVRQGLGEAEVFIARWLQKRKIPCMLVLNKCDGGFEEVPEEEVVLLAL